MQKSEISNALLLKHLEHVTHFLRSCINFAPCIGTLMLDGRKLIKNYPMIRNDNSLQRFIFVATRNMKERTKSQKHRHRLCDERFFILFSFLSKQKHTMINLLPPFSPISSLRHV